VNTGDFRYYASHFSGLHGLWVYNGDVPTVRILSVPGFQAGSNLGIGKDGQGFYSVKVWACNSVCYDPKYTALGGSADRRSAARTRC
jgi:hypothetical protein